MARSWSPTTWYMLLQHRCAILDLPMTFPKGLQKLLVYSWNRHPCLQQAAFYLSTYEWESGFDPASEQGGCLLATSPSVPALKPFPWQCLAFDFLHQVGALNLNQELFLWNPDLLDWDVLSPFCCSLAWYASFQLRPPGQASAISRAAATWLCSREH